MEVRKRNDGCVRVKMCKHERKILSPVQKRQVRSSEEGSKALETLSREIFLVSTVDVYIRWLIVRMCVTSTDLDPLNTQLVTTFRAKHIRKGLLFQGCARDGAYPLSGTTVTRVTS
jgi:hypothetical protein